MKIHRTAKGRHKQGHWKWMMDIFQERLEEVMPVLAEKLEFKLPPHIHLRPFNTKNGSATINGRATYTRADGHSIIMCLEECTKMKDYGMWVVDHECAHIACGIKHDNWTHDKVFTAAFVQAMLVPAKTIYLKDEEGMSVIDMV